jgi:hypothetical protein
MGQAVAEDIESANGARTPTPFQGRHVASLANRIGRIEHGIGNIGFELFFYLSGVLLLVLTCGLRPKTERVWRTP